MAEYQRIDCKCGHGYLTKEMISRCPKCDKTNYTLAGGLMYILIIVAIVIFVALLIGSALWSYFARKEKWKWYHLVGSMILGSYGLYVFYELDRTDNYPTLLWVSYFCNGAGVLLALYTLIENIQLNSVSENTSAVEGRQTEKRSIRNVLIFVGVVILTFIGIIAYKQFESNTTVQDSTIVESDTSTVVPATNHSNSVAVDSTDSQINDQQNRPMESYWGQVFESSDMGKLERIIFDGNQLNPEIKYQSDGGTMMGLGLNDEQTALHFTNRPNVHYELTNLLSDQFTLLNPDGRSQVFRLVNSSDIQE